MSQPFNPISGKTQLVGIIGWPVAHSLSPAMHNAAFAAAGLPWAYVPLPVPPTPELIADALRGLPALGFHGVNVTVPHKQAVMPLLDGLEPAAEAIGAVNTIVIEQRDNQAALFGYNTDWSGFLDDCTAKQIEIAGRDCWVLGAGGSARAIVYALAKSGGRVTVLARRPEQAQQLASTLNEVLSDVTPIQAAPFIPALLPFLAKPTAPPLIVHTTPVGMSPKIEDCLWPPQLPLPTNATVYDLIYNPPQTKLLQMAAASRCLAYNGLGMLLHQGARAFELWTGQKPNLATMQTALTPAKEVLP